MSMQLSDGRRCILATFTSEITHLSLPNDIHGIVAHGKESAYEKGKEAACSTGDRDSIPGLGRSPGEGSGNPLQVSCLEIPWTEDPGGLQFKGP